MEIAPIAGPVGRISPAVSERLVPRSTIDLHEGRTLAYAEAGTGSPVVLIHGTLMSLEDMWLGLVPHLAERFRVIAVDRPGHGFSRRRGAADAELWRQAALIREGVRALGLERPIIVGHSFGGALALAYGLRFPDEIAGVVALAPICFPEPRLEHLLFGPRAVPGGRFASDLLGRTMDPALLPLLWNAMFLPATMPPDYAAANPFGLAGTADQLVAEGEDAAGLMAGLIRSALAYPACRVPVRILGGDSDLVVSTPRHGSWASRLIPEAAFTLLTRTGHMLHHQHPGAVVNAVRAIAGHDPAQG
ncbi:alpha/beta hydrolase [Methylobacterium sp. Leaf88]|nr:alpha/beta hydrolase [Methylobacterium sp. Leaf88]